MRIEKVAFGSARYQEMVEKREAWLRAPLGLGARPQDTARDEEEIHIAAIDKDRVIGVLLLRPLDTARVKMRQVAVAPASSGRGVGTRLVEFSERLARDAGFQIIELHARQTAVPFYEKLAYTVVSEPFEEIGIPHVKMEKKLEG